MRYQSNFSEYMEGFVNQKRALGYKYSCQEAMLRRFDAFCIKFYPNETTLNEKIVMAWAEKKAHESSSTFQGRVTPVRELAEYMHCLGINAFIMPKGLVTKSQRYIPYIYSNEELRKIFCQTDRCHYCSEVPYRHYVMPIFFRLLYCCGLRVSEARMLKVEDIDLAEGIITINFAKQGKHRQIPVSEELLVRLKTFNENVHKFSCPEDWFFPGYNKKPMTISNVYKNFRRFLWQARISHGGRGKGPRIHDLRHTFSVHCLKKWVLEDKNLQAYLPVLQAYLGHSSIKDTAYYLHLTADLFPNITESLERTLGSIIPEAGDCNETD